MDKTHQREVKTKVTPAQAAWMDKERARTGHSMTVIVRDAIALAMRVEEWTKAEIGKGNTP